MNTKYLKTIAATIVSIALVVAALTVITSSSVQGSGSLTLRAVQTDVITVDDCEYIVFTDSKNHSSMVHKQNCTYCTKRSKLNNEK